MCLVSIVNMSPIEFGQCVILHDIQFTKNRYRGVYDHGSNTNKIYFCISLVTQYSEYTGLLLKTVVSLCIEVYKPIRTQRALAHGVDLGQVLAFLLKTGLRSDLGSI